MGLGFALSFAPAYCCGLALLRFAYASAAEQSGGAGMAGVPLLLQGVWLHPLPGSPKATAG